MTNRVNEIDRQAALWLAKLDRDASASDKAAFEAWLAADIRHRGAYLRAKTVMAHVNRHRFPLRARFKFPQPGTMSRRWMMFGGAGTAIAASLAAAFFLTAPITTPELPVSYATGLGEHRDVHLADGSVMTLDAATKLTVRLTKDRREIALLQGQALFQVAKNKARPFIVSAHGIGVRAVGTRFAVRAVEQQPLRVLVEEGIVRVESDHPLAELTANMRATVSASGTVTSNTVAPQELAQDLAWRDGRLVFRRATLSEAAQEFARYSSTRIVIPDPAIAKLTITGAFDGTNPSGFAMAVAHSLDLAAIPGTHEIRLIRKNS
jgi:Fe2+-dicitrate sensor, membrane component